MISRSKAVSIDHLIGFCRSLVRYRSAKRGHTHLTKHSLSVLVLVVAFAGLAPGGNVYAAVPMDGIVAVVNGDIIMASELHRRLSRVMTEIQQRGTEMPPPDVLEGEVLERLIVQKIQLQIARQASLSVEDSDLDQAIANIAGQNNLSPAEFRQIIQNEGYNFGRFREDMRDEILVTRVRQNQIDNRIQITDSEISSYLAAGSTQGGPTGGYNIAHILLAYPKGASGGERAAVRKKATKILSELRGGADFAQMAATVSDSRQAQQGGRIGWRSRAQLPSLFVGPVQNMQPGQVSDLIESSGGLHIIKLLEVRGDQAIQTNQVHMINQTRVRHLLIKIDELVSDEDAGQRIAKLRARITGGEDFAELAKSHSDDSGSAVKGGDLGWVSPGVLVPPFEEAMNQLPPNQLSEPVKTRFGWHLIQVLQRREFDGTKEIKRAQAREAIRRRRIEEEHRDWVQQLRDEAYVEYRLARE